MIRIEVLPCPIVQMVLVILVDFLPRQNVLHPLFRQTDRQPDTMNARVRSLRKIHWRLYTVRSCPHQHHHHHHHYREMLDHWIRGMRMQKNSIIIYSWLFRHNSVSVSVHVCLVPIFEVVVCRAHRRYWFCCSSCGWTHPFISIATFTTK